NQVPKNDPLPLFLCRSIATEQAKRQSTAAAGAMPGAQKLSQNGLQTHENLRQSKRQSGQRTASRLQGSHQHRALPKSHWGNYFGDRKLPILGS
ncbi:hypothetical protein, partial [Novipirellula herctigrandis]|uniref:hypothetical protein n=1 Tax=Novipirellula herctigrandis TaxID=2527986 RepID=UPI003AF361D3